MDRAGRGVPLQVRPRVGDGQPRPDGIPMGTSTANQPGIAPVAPSQPYTGRIGIPTANGSHDQAVPFAHRS